MFGLEDFLTIQQAADFLGVAPNTLRYWEKNGKISVYRHPNNNYRLYKKEDLENILRAIKASVINQIA